MPFRLVPNPLIIVCVTANEAGPFDFVFDTSADITIGDPSIASPFSRFLRPRQPNHALKRAIRVSRVLAQLGARRSSDMCEALEYTHERGTVHRGSETSE